MQTLFRASLFQRPLYRQVRDCMRQVVRSSSDYRRGGENAPFILCDLIYNQRGSKIHLMNTKQCQVNLVFLDVL